MYNQHRNLLFTEYNRAKNYFYQNPNKLIFLEEFIRNAVKNVIEVNKDEIIRDYNEASFLQPFWGNYPPEDRGRQPVGDQIPWIEVGEHSVGHKISRLLSSQFSIREVGLPSGSDDRYVLTDSIIGELSDFTNSVMLFIDVKSVGPRDDAEHIVVSPYQVSGDGIWNCVNEKLQNSPMRATGARASHDFFPAVSPIYILSDGTICPTIHIFIKPVYKMMNQQNPTRSGQPLSKIRIITVPNGLLLTLNPNYLRSNPTLIFPGKDDKGKDPKKLRCRVSFDILNRINAWRVSTINCE